MPSASLKRPGDIPLDDHQVVLKTAKVDDISNVSESTLTDNARARRKQSGSTRTGQACDRCKIRKIRCDARPGGCSPCIQNQTECKTTDRITGRATSRGHTENLENENASLRLYIAELQAQLKDNGLEPRPPSIHNAGPQEGRVFSVTLNPVGKQNDAAPGEANSSDSQTQPEDDQLSTISVLPGFRSGLTGDNYLGVSSKNTWGLSPIEGSALTLFGTKIDLTDFMPAQDTPESIAMSYETFLKYAFGRETPPCIPSLPEYEPCKVFTDWYLRSVQPMLPILHKPDVMQLLDRVYHEGHVMTPAETVMIHMVLAMMNFQWSARNKNPQSRMASFEHYHYCLTFIPRLVESHQLDDLQALALICTFLRAQPRPEAAWFFTNLVLGLAIESGLHRSVKAWQSSDLSSHVIEMRKRIFWCLLTMHAIIGGKLGRPMPLQSEDFDTEIPSPNPDNLASENFSKWKRCSFRSFIPVCGLTKVQIAVFGGIYSVRSASQPYEKLIQQLDKDLDIFQKSIPRELSLASDLSDEDRVPALYLQGVVSECLILVHHPAICRSNSEEVINNNLDICLKESATLLSIAIQLQRLKSLDTTWYYTMGYLAAISTTLFVHHARRDQLTSADLHRLREDMNSWTDVMGEIGNLLGTGLKLQVTVRSMMDTVLSGITSHVAAKTASAAVASVPSPASSDDQQLPPTTLGPSAVYTNTPHGAGHTNVHTPDRSRHYNVEQHAAPNESPHDHAYSTADHFTYPAVAGANIALQSHNPGFPTSNYDHGGMKPNFDDNMNVMTPQHHQHTMHQQSSQQQQQAPARGPNDMRTQEALVAAFRPSSQAPETFQHVVPSINHPVAELPAAWQNFSDNMMVDFSHREYMPPVDNSIHLTHGQHPNHFDLNSAMSSQLVSGQLADGRSAQQMWPLVHYQNHSNDS